MQDLSRQFASYYNSLVDNWRALNENWALFCEYQRETIALYFFNSDYGGNGLADYVAWHGREMLDVTLRGLQRIGADRLAEIVRHYFDLLSNYGYDAQQGDPSDFIDACLPAVRNEFHELETEAASLYSHFYARWEARFATTGIVKPGKRIMFRGTLVMEDWPERLQRAQSKKTYMIGSKVFFRIPYGSETSDWDAEHRKCHDCSAVKGELHVVGCDVEECPRCKGQAILCECPYDETRSSE